MKLYEKTVDLLCNRSLKENYDNALFKAYRIKNARRILQLFSTPKHPKKWVFIIGCYNSGTTLLNRLLGGHPQISILNREGVQLTDQLPVPEMFGWNRMWHKCLDKLVIAESQNKRKVETIIHDWSFYYKKGSSVFVEKSISNAVRMKWLEINFQPAYFVYITRNPYAVAGGIRKKALPGPPVNELYPDGYPIELTAKQWLTSIELVERESQRIERFYHLTYEKLCRDPVATLSGIFTFLELEQPDIKTDGIKLIIGNYTEEVSNFNAKSFDRLSDKDMVGINKTLGPNIQRYGYEQI